MDKKMWIIEMGQLPDPELGPNKRNHWGPMIVYRENAKALIGGIIQDDKVQKFPQHPVKKAHIDIRFIAKDKIRRDVDNLIASMKSYIDGLVDFGILEDDSYKHVGYTCSYEIGKKANTIITITDVGEE
jgi:Holliday junction resolvase RusA-like endonuclease